MVMSNNNLYGYESDFKEQHSKHIKRPALVAIRKPLLAIDEMEEILTRLLVLYVPPTQLSVSFKGIRRGIGRKAFLMDWVRSEKQEDPNKEQFIPNALYEIGNKENVFLSTAQLATYGQKEDPLNADQVLSPDKISSYLNTYKQGGKLYRTGDRSFKEYIGDAVKRAQDSFVQPPKNGDKFTLYLLSPEDHNYLNPDEKTKTTQVKELLEHPDLFSNPLYGDKFFPTYFGKPVVIWDPQKPNITVAQGSDGKDPILNKTLVKKSFGYVPKQKIYAYRWDFMVPYTVKVNIALESQKTSSVSEQNKDELISKYLDILKSKLNNLYAIMHDYTWVDGVLDGTVALGESVLNVWNSANNNAADVIAQNRNTYNSCYENLGKWLNLNTSTLTASDTATVSDKKYQYGIKLCNFIKEHKSLIDKYNSQTIITGEHVTRIYGTSGGVSTVGLGTLMWAYCQEYLASVNADFKYNENAVALLMRGEKAQQRIKQELNEAAANAVKERFTTSTAYKKDLTYTDFKIKYYAVLLKKVFAKEQALNSFIEEKLVTVAFKTELDWLKNIIETNPTFDPNKGGITEKTEKELKLRFIKYAETVLFSPISGFYITSYAEGLDEVKAPIWNSLADSSNFNATLYGTDLGPDATYALLDSQNKDVSHISIDRVVNGKSLARLTIKNNKEKYNYSRSDVLNRSKFIIEPMDEVVIFLPTIKFDKTGGISTYAGELEQVFAGVISSVGEINDGGYHSISITAECAKKLMQVNRTNVKPSATRDENKNNPLTPFIVPEKFYKSIEYWMPLMFAQSLTYMRCMLKETTEANYNELLVHAERTAVERPQTFYSIKKVEHTIDSTEVVDVPKYYKLTTAKPGELITTYNQSTITNISKEEYDKAKGIGLYGDSGSYLVSGGYEGLGTHTTYYTATAKETKTVKKKIEDLSTYTYKKNTTIGYYNQIRFADTLCEYLWYKKCSKYMPDEERQRIEQSLWALLSDYVYTTKIDNSKSVTSEPGITPLDKILQDGYRAAYLVYKQRFMGTMFGDPTLNDKLLVARIIGTSQPAYRLETQDLSIQFSNWVTNNDIINEQAERFNFVYYSDRDGILNFTPYNFDLTTLNTSNYTKNTIDTDKMLVTRSSRDLENDDNPQILKTQYMIDYRKNIDDSKIVNWVQISGNWVLSTSADNMTKALVTDPVLIKKFGYRAAKQISILGLQDQDALRLYGLSWMDRQNKQYISAEANYMFDARMDINLPYYVPSDETMYYCSDMRITYEPGTTCTCNLILNYGRQPLMNVETYSQTTPILSKKDPTLSGSHRLNPADTTNAVTMLDKLQTLFLKENAIKPFTYTQYKKLFTKKSETVTIDNLVNALTTITPSLSNTVTQEYDIDGITRNAAICCYNGYLWDNVAGISFEELVYNYAWLYDGKNTAGIIAAVGSSGKFNDSLTKKIFQATGNMNVSVEEQNAINTFFIDVPAIQAPNKLPEVFVAKEEKFTDLAVNNIVDIDWNASTK